jgi:hypothetical protein
MSNQLIQGPILDARDVWVYNDSANDMIERGHIVAWDTTTTAHKVDPNTTYTGERGPLEGATTVELNDVRPAPTTVTIRIVGIAQKQIKPGTWGFVRRYGPGVVMCEETLTDAHLTAYGVSATTAGVAREVTAASAVALCCQLGESGATADGDLRSVFIDCGVATNIVDRPLGTWV